LIRNLLSPAVQVQLIADRGPGAGAVELDHGPPIPTGHKCPNVLARPSLRRRPFDRAHNHGGRVIAGHVLRDDSERHELAAVLEVGTQVRAGRNRRLVPSGLMSATATATTAAPIVPTAAARD